MFKFGMGKGGGGGGRKRLHLGTMIGSSLQFVFSEGGFFWGAILSNGSAFPSLLTISLLERSSDQSASLLTTFLTC